MEKNTKGIRLDNLIKAIINEIMDEYVPSETFMSMMAKKITDRLVE